MSDKSDKMNTKPTDAPAKHPLIDQIKAARRVSVPLVGIATPDPGATIQAICDAIKGSGKIMWDAVEGMRPRDEAAKEIIAKLIGDQDPTIGNPIELLRLARKLPEEAVLFMHLANRWLAEPMVIQAAWNLRDEFKLNRRMLVLLGPSIDLPAELAGDVIVFDEPLPDREELGRIIREQHEAVSLPYEGEVREKAVEAVQGLPAFQAEQVVAMSLTRAGLDVPALWERKRRQIELTPGLKVHREAVRFEQIGGVKTIKQFLRQILTGQARPNAIVFIDEIEKHLAGASGGAADSSGVSQDQLGSLLSYMQDHQAAGCIFIGPPGSAKSMVAKAAGNEAGVPTIQLDMGGLKGSLVGQSEQNLRNALKVISSVSNGQSLWIATCNAIGELPPELRRRFTLGTYFFDLPDEQERASIWNLYCREYFGVSAEQTPIPLSDGWTGAEIRQCADIAWRLGCSLIDAAKYIVPVSRSAAEQLERLRKMAEGRFLSASHGGMYQRQDETPINTTQRRPRRLATVED